jgi:hypothetical protein
MPSARIFKYPLEVEHRVLVQMHKSAHVLWVAEQQSQLVLYAQVDWPEPGPIEARVFQVVTTGDEYETTGKVYLGSAALSEWFVAHVFEYVSLTPIHPDVVDVVDRRRTDDFLAIRQEQHEEAISTKVA